VAKYHHKRRRHIRDYFVLAKDGVITGAADDDPSGIVTYIQVGALTKFSQLWLIFLTLPMLIVVEDMSARVGVITKKGLNLVIEEHYGRLWAWFAMVLVVICNTATLGADMAGMAAVIEMFTGIPFLWFLLPIGLIILALLIREGYALVSRVLFIISPILLVYIVNVLLTKPNWSQIAGATVIPTIHLNATFLSAAVALFGTTISAYLLFWQTNEEIEEGKTIEDLKDETLGVRFGMVFASLVFYFIILAGAIVLYGHVGLNVNNWSAADIAMALKPLAGKLSYLLFSIGILGSGIVAVPVLALTTAYVVRDTLKWNEGMDDKLSKARGFYLVIGLSLAVGALLSLIGIKPMAMLFYSQVLQGVLTPILLIFLILTSNNKRVMGEHTNGFWANFIGWATVVVMLVLSAAMFWQLFAPAVKL
jgi:Mn2+/Fe2+ NRAMP family transporter